MSQKVYHEHSSMFTQSNYREIRISGNSLKKYFTVYPRLKKQKQYIQIEEKNKTDVLSVTCGVPQGSTLGPLLFLLYVNDLPNAPNILVPIMFADDTNLFFSNCNIPVLFATVNSELGKISH